MEKQIIIFYAHSSHRQSVLDTYDRVVKFYENDDRVKTLDVDDVPTNNNIFIYNIIDTMKLADFMICDITPDFRPQEHEGKREIK
jgi:hypothetical protein